MSNRVEELESQVAQLQAAVDGLTEELVETRERLKQLESEHEIEVKRAPEPRTPAGGDEAAEESAEPADTDEPGAEGDKATETETRNEESESEDSDIIVA